ncbi:MAG: T9SS type A sorting domain-containing protein [Crocinitomicaceae bacterium]|nr:T9SS type A sorting domain-containing protein [Crocinitomicaceae bacterium]
MNYLHKLILTTVLFLPVLNFAQHPQYIYQGISIGEDATTGTAVCDEAYMSEIIKIGGTYYMYYTTKFAATNEDAIAYATSTDLETWVIQDTIMTGSSTTTDPEYVLGGARVIKLTSGQYRMFYRCAPQYIPPAEPQYHIRSAISNDGINFTKEGVRISNEFFTAGSYFTHVGHSEFYFDQGGNVSALLTGKDTTMSSGPDKIYTAVSFDEGLTFSNFTPLFDNSHDPVVIEDSSGVWHAYFTYLDEGFRTSTSTNGVVWTSPADTIYFMQDETTLTESSYPKIADLGAAVADDGTIYIYSNYATVLGPWTNIAWYLFGGYNGIESPGLQENYLISCWPNPVSEYLNISIAYSNDISDYGIEMELRNMTGQLIYSSVAFDQMSQIDVSNIPAGIYTLHVKHQNQISVFKISVVASLN